MTNTMEKERLDDLSAYYFFVNLFSTLTIVKVVEGFPTENLTIPTVAVDYESINTMPWELGNKKRNQLKLFHIDTFASSKVQRDEISYKILKSLEDNIPVYDYNEGFPPVVSPTQLGVLIPDDIKLEVIKIRPELTDILYYRTTVSFVADYSPFNGG